jgi:hypothetical protein
MIMVVVGIVAMFAFAVLVIDGAALLTTRTQLSAAADAAALAGASGLLEGSRTVAVQRAVDYSSYNKAYRETETPVVISASDVSFPADDVIRVDTHRTAATGDPIRTFFLKVIDAASGGTADVTAAAAARAFDVCGSRCLKPWSVPDRWDDANANGVYDEGEFYDPDATGYIAPVDVGTPIALKTGNPQQAIEPGIFYPVNFPPLDDESGESPLTGASWYETWIAGCEPYHVEPGDRLQLEPGNMVGPTIHGMEDLIAMDPGAQWDPTSGAVVGSNFGLSPRVGLIPFFDPTLPPSSGRNYVTITKIAAFFIENVGPGSQVTGRFIQITTQGSPCPGSGGVGTSMLKGIALIE